MPKNRYSYINIFVLINAYLILLVKMHNQGDLNSRIICPYDSITHYMASITTDLTDTVRTKSQVYAGKSFPKPQSFSILMNFRHDGQQSIILMDQQQSIYWSDAGYCAHGQMYDPVKKICRSLFCEDGYDFSRKACVKNNASQTAGQLTSKCPEEMTIELTVNNKMCTLVEGFNDTSNCSSEIIGKHPNLTFHVHEILSKLLEIKNNRVQNITVV